MVKAAASRAEGGAEGVQRLAQGGGDAAGDLSLRLVLVVGLDQLGVLLLDLLGVLARRAEQQRLQVVKQILACLLGHLPIGRACFQVAHERGRRGSGRGQRAGVPGGGGRRAAARMSRRFGRLMR